MVDECLLFVCIVIDKPIQYYISAGGSSILEYFHNITVLVVYILFIRYYFPCIGESGVGKSALVKNLLAQLGKDKGTSYKSGTVLGDILHFSSKNQALLDNISTLTKTAGGEEGLTLLHTDL